MQTVSLMVGPLVAILDEFCIWAETKGRSQAIYSAPSCLSVRVPDLNFNFVCKHKQSFFGAM